VAFYLLTELRLRSIDQHALFHEGFGVEIPGRDRTHDFERYLLNKIINKVEIRAV
jgi:hypothetical protein